MDDQGNLVMSDPHDQLNEIINALNLDKVILLFEWIFIKLFLWEYVIKLTCQLNSRSAKHFLNLVDKRIAALFLEFRGKVWRILIRK